jgi:hypothetical protein
MPNSKISALTSATTPLAGTETLPVVQSSTTKQVSVANLTAGRAVNALSIALGTGTNAFSIGGTQVSLTNTSANTYLSVYAGSGGSTQGGFLLGANNTENQANVLWVQSGNYLQIASNPASSTIKMLAGGATVGTFQSNGLAVPNGLGIDFSATPGTGTSELFADYEEGTWTPVGNGVALTTAIGVYTKIGRAVTFSGNVTFPITANANPALFTGLPFTVNASAAANGNGSIGSSTYAAPMTGRVLQGFDRWYNFAIGGGLLTNANLSGVSIEFGGTYIV